MFNTIKCIRKKNLFFLIFLYFMFLNLVNADNLKKNNVGIRIELVGTITGKHVLAILRIKNQSEGIYQVNQTILGYTITTITKKTVTLVKHNQSSTLTLIPVKNRKYNGLNTNPTTLTIYEYRINRNIINSLQSDTQTWLNNIHMKMHTEDGYFTGYQITQIQENSPAALLGLAEGDIITGINNIFIKQNPEHFITKIGLLKNAKQFTLNMKNEDVDFKLKFTITDDEKSK